MSGPRKKFECRVCHHDEYEIEVRPMTFRTSFGLNPNGLDPIFYYCAKCTTMFFNLEAFSVLGKEVKERSSD